MHNKQHTSSVVIPRRYEGIAMNIVKNIKVPTGNILVIDGEHGQLEMLSLGDYGKEVNVKCDAMGLTREIQQVTHTDLLPLEEKWVVTISTQYGCRCNCSFCDVPKVGKGKNATKQDLIDQVYTALNLHPDVSYTNRLNIHYARMGEPTFNPNVLEATAYLFRKLTPMGFKIHPVVSTMMPRNNEWLRLFIHHWMGIKNTYLQGEAGLQLSINSTDEAERNFMFNKQAHTIPEIAGIMGNTVPRGRKITLNFALAGYTIDPEVLLKHFPPDRYLVKLTPMHKTKACIDRDIRTQGDYTTYEPYQETEEILVKAGYDVLVFIASEYEDLGRITCGNAILSGTMPEVPHEVII